MVGFGFQESYADSDDLLGDLCAILTSISRFCRLRILNLYCENNSPHSR